MAIRQKIEQGVLSPNDRIIEIDLSDELRMSRTPVREALRRLVDERWLEYLPNRGMRVRVWDRKDIQDNFQVRLLLETEATALAARYISPADIERLAMLNGQLRSMAGFRTREDAIEKMTGLNLDFHRGIWRASGNRILAEILQRNINIPTVYSTYRHYDERKLYDSLDEHDQMLRSFEERDEEQARELMQNHLQRASGIFVED